MKDPTKLAIWSLAFIVVCLGVWVCPGQPVPPFPKRPNQSAVIHQGAGSAALISKLAVIVPPSPRTNTIVWKYPTGIVASNLWWNVESSTDLRTWSVLVSNATGPAEVRVKRTDPPGFYRLAGRLSP
jgi:hypothetical protein